MREFTLLGLSTVLLQVVTATGNGWRDQVEYFCPKNTKNDCTTDENNGFDWSDLTEGAFSNYKGYNFNGWNCASKLGKRNLERRTFNDKCIETDLSDNDFSNEINCDKSFSIGELDISVDQDADVEFHYGMPDGTTCKQTRRCGTEGTTVTNDQCGGAKTVKIKLPKNGSTRKCTLGIHKVRFECGTAIISIPVPTTTIPAATTPDITTSTVNICTTPSDCSGDTCTMPTGCTTGDVSLTPTPITSTGVSFPTGDSCTIPTGCASTIVSIEPSETCSSPSDCSGESCTMPAGCTPGPTSDFQLTTSDISSTIAAPGNTCTIPSNCTGASCTIPTGCVSITSTFGTSTSALVTDSMLTTTLSTLVSTTVISIPTEVPSGSSPFSSSTIDATFTTTSSAIVPEVTMPATECPDVLPRCLKTWLFITSCTDSADPTCFCPEEDFVNKVVDCLSSWGADDTEVASSVEYFLGLCNSYIPGNPAIITAIPPAITLPAPSANVPVQTITHTITTILPCEPITITAGSSSGSVVTLTTSAVTKIITIPQVTLVVTATDATLVYPTKEVDVIATTSVPSGGVSTSIPSKTNVPSIFISTSTAIITYTAGPKTTLVTYPAGSGAITTGNSSLPVSTDIPLFTGAASSNIPATFITMIGVSAAIWLQL